MGDGFFGRQISRRDFFRKAGVGVGALSIARQLSANPAAAATRLAQATDPTQPLMLARVRPSSAAEAVALAVFDDTHRRFDDGSVELLLWPGDLARLKDLGVDFKVTCTDLAKRDIESARKAEAGDVLPLGLVAMPGGDRTSYRVLADYESELKGLVHSYPYQARLVTLTERTLEGRPVYGIEIAGDVGRVDGRPMAYIDGVHHAREWPAAEYPMIFAHHLLEGYGKDPRVTSLLDACRVTVVPIQNPDGFHGSRGGIENANLGIVAGGQGAYWRKNRRGAGLEDDTPANPTAYGIDTNRNYPFLWGATTGGALGLVDDAPVYASTSPSPADQTYYGSAPLSEPENRNVAAYLMARNVTGMITNHTYGRLVLRPWGHTQDETVDEELMAAIGAQMATAMGGYTNQIGLGLYPTTGTTDDWYYAAASAIGYTFEHNTAFHPAYTSGPNAVRNFWPRAIEAYMILSEAAADPSKHCVIRGRAHEPDDVERGVLVSLNGHKEFDTAMWPQGAGGVGPLLLQRSSTHEVLDMNAAGAPDGTLEWHINPTTRPLEAAAGRTETLKVKISAPGRATIEHDVLLRRGEELDLGSFPVS